MRAIFIFLAPILFFNCFEKKEIYSLPTFSESNNVNSIIEIPGGTNKKYEYNKKSKKFEIDIIDGNERVIKFLSYPANYGFITSTFSNPAKGGDGDALDIVVISESLETGTVIEIIPIAILKLIDNHKYDYKIIGIPADKNLRIINAVSLNELRANHPKILQILELWFLNYDKGDLIEIDGWGNEKEAILEIKKAMN